MKKFTLLLLLFIALFANYALTQTAVVTPGSLSPAVTTCFDSTEHQFSISNTDSEDLTYEISFQAYGFDATKAGKIKSQLQNSVYGYMGFTIVDDYIYTIGWGSTIYKFNLYTGQYINGWGMHSNAWGIVYDGEYLWIGDNTGLLRSYNLNGTATGNSIQLPVSGNLLLAWDGENFITGVQSTNPTIYKVNKTGSVLETYTSNTGTHIYTFTWVEKHAEGHLWAIGNNNKIMQLGLSGTVFQKVHEFNKPSNFYYYGLAHDGTNLVHVNGSYITIKFDDGVLEAENWINLSSNSGTVSGGGSQLIDIEFNAKNLLTGNFEADIVVKSNDPVDPTSTISTTFSVQGDSEIEVSMSSSDFGDVFINGYKTDTIMVYNKGCEVLNISNLVIDAGEFTSTISTASIDPLDSLYLPITFSPGSETYYTGTLTIQNDDANQVINLTGTGIASPAASLDTYDLNPTVTVCEDSITHQFTIQNTGLGELTYNSTLETYGFDASKAGTIKSQLSPQIYGYYGFTIVDNYIYTIGWRDRIYKYNLNTGQYLGEWGMHLGAWGIVYDGQYLWIGDETGLLRSYNLNGTATGYSIQLPVSGSLLLAYDGENFITGVQSTNPTIYKVNKTGSVLETYTSNAGTHIYTFTWAKKHAEGQLWALGSNGKIMQLGLSGTVFQKVHEFTKPSNFYYYSLAHDGKDLVHVNGNYVFYKFDDGIIEADRWTNLSATTGSISGGSTQQIDIEFNAKNLIAGIYSADLIVNSDDPLNTSDTITCTFTVEGTPTIEVSQTNFAFGNVFLGGTKSDTLVIHNTGCDTLKVSDVILTSTKFAANASVFNILPKDSLYLQISFNPVIEGSATAKITLKSNDTDMFIFLSGTGIGSPEASVSTHLLDVTATQCFETKTSTFKINNTGDGTLTYNNRIQSYGFDASKAGVIKSQLPNQIYGIYGFTIVGDYIYTTGWRDRIYKYNLNTGQYQGEWGMHSNAWGIVYDGQFLWIGDNQGKLRSYNLNGSATGNFIQLPVSGELLLAWDGENFIAATQSSNPTIYKVNKAGSVLATYSSNVGTHIYAFTWVEKHAEGHLWALGNNGKIMQLTLSGTVFQKVHEFNKPSGVWVYTLAHDGNDLLHVNNNYILYKFDDGVLEAENWMNISSNSGSIAPDNKQTITAEFTSDNLLSGLYKVDIVIKTDDPLNPVETIVCEFTVDGEPTFLISDEEFDFGDVWVSETNTHTFSIDNTGCDTLKIYSIASNMSDFTADMNTFTILPDGSETITLTFEPTYNGLQNAVLTISSNVGDSIINLTGNGFAPIVESITTTKPDGYYKSTEIIDFVVTFDYPMDVSGTPRIKLNTDPTTYATYFSGTGSTELTFRYTVGATENTLDLDYTSINDLTLNGGSIIRSATTYYADLRLPAVGEIANAHSIVIDNVAPAPVLSSNTTINTNKNPLPLTISFNEIVTGFDLGDLTVTNGSASNLVSLLSGAKYTVDIIPAAEGLITIDLNAGTSQDLAGNTSLVATQLSRTYDNSPASVSLSSTSTSPTSNNPVVLKVRFSDEVYGFSLSDLVITNGSAANLVELETRKTYTIDLLPTVAGTVTVNLPYGTTADISGNYTTTATPFSIVCNAISPTVTLSLAGTNPTNASSIVATVLFSEVVTGFDISDVDVSNGTVSGLTTVVAGKQFTLTISPVNEGTVSLNLNANKVVSLSGAGNAKATQVSTVYDNTAPTASLSTGSASPTNAASFNITVNFNETVNGFALTDITVGNGTASNLQTVVAGKQYTATITPTADGTVAVNVPANGAADDAGNGNIAASQLSIVSDKSSPAVTLSTSSASTTNNNPIIVTIEFNEVVTGFQLADIAIGNGKASNFVTVISGTKYTVNVTPSANGEVTANVPAAIAVDNAGNANSAASQLSVSYDGTGPSVAISTALSNPTNANPMSFTIDFSETVSGFELTDLSVSNGTASNLVAVIAGKQFTVSIAPSSEGTVTLKVPANAATDASGNGNTASAETSIAYDIASPTVAISSKSTNITNSNPIVLSINFNEVVTGFELADVVIQNGTASNLIETVSGKQFTLNITPTSEGTVSATIAAGIANDIAGNGNTAASQFSRTYDATAPIATISTTAVSPTNTASINLTIDFDEAVIGFGLPYVYTANGNGSNFVEVTAGLKYTMKVSPLTDGNVTMYVAGGVISDAAGNGNIASSQIVIAYDKTAPSLMGITLTEVSSNTAKFTLSSNENGKVYYQVFLEETSEPTAQSIITNSGDSIIASGNFNVVDGEENEVSLTGLAMGETYSLYMVVEDALKNNSKIYNVDFNTSLVGVAEFKNSNIQLYPNPNRGEFFIDVKDAGIQDAYITVRDISGSVIKNLKLTEAKQKIELKDQAQGVYFVQIQLTNAVYTYKFVIE